MAFRWSTSDVPPRQLSNLNLACSSGDRRESFLFTCSRTLMVWVLTSMTMSSYKIKWINRKCKWLDLVELKESFPIASLTNHMVYCLSLSSLDLSFNDWTIIVILRWCFRNLRFLIFISCWDHSSKSFPNQTVLRCRLYKCLHFAQQFLTFGKFIYAKGKTNKFFGSVL